MSGIVSTNPLFKLWVDLNRFGKAAPVFNKKSGLVEGILLSGDSDYVIDDLDSENESKCLIPRYSETGKEKILKVTAIEEIQWVETILKNTH